MFDRAQLRKKNRKQRRKAKKDNEGTRFSDKEKKKGGYILSQYPASTKNINGFLLSHTGDRLCKMYVESWLEQSSQPAKDQTCTNFKMTAIQPLNIWWESLLGHRFLQIPFQSRRHTSYWFYSLRNVNRVRICLFKELQAVMGQNSENSSLLWSIQCLWLSVDCIWCHNTVV